MNPIAEALLTLPSSVYNCLYIDRRAVCYNYQHIQQMVGAATSGAVVKADAYNMGLQPVTQTLSEAGCNVFFVAYLDEGIALRQCLSDCDATIYVFNGFLAGCEEEFVKYNLTPVLTDFDQIERGRVFARKQERSLPIALHVDTGMRRTGLPFDQLTELSSQTFKDLSFKLVLSHFASADVSDPTFNTVQYNRFLNALSHLPEAPASLANSNGIFLNPSYHFQIVRPGKALYGLNPLLNQPNPMRSVASVWARIYQIQTVQAGETVGYSQTYTAKRRERIATIMIGYADGMPWLMGNQGFVSIRGFKAPIAGRISMDLMTVDVTDIPESLLFSGQWVEIMGGSADMEEWATGVQSISYEILLGLGKRLTRVYSG